MDATAQRIQQQLDMLDDVIAAAAALEEQANNAADRLRRQEMEFRTHCEGLKTALIKLTASLPDAVSITVASKLTEAADKAAITMQTSWGDANQAAERAAKTFNNAVHDYQLQRDTSLRTSVVRLVSAFLAGVVLGALTVFCALSLTS
jgi:hypothetical protein